MKKIIIDFDSTFITTEGLEELAKISLHLRENKEEVVQKITDITNEGMEGKISFTESLNKRIKILLATKEHVIKLSEKLKDQITPSVEKNREWIKNNKENIFIFSGGFHDFIDETLLDFELKGENVFANYFEYDKDGKITGFDQRNLLSQAGGKVKLLRELDLGKDTIVVGDGWTDYEMKQAGLADTFVAFTENVAREKVIKNADHVVKNFDEVIDILQEKNI